MTRDQLVRQFELAADRFHGLQHVLIAWPRGSTMIDPYVDLPREFQPRVAYAGSTGFSAWPNDCSGGDLPIDGYATYGFLRMNLRARRWKPDAADASLADLELEARCRYQSLAESGVALVNDPRGLKWSVLLHERLQPTRYPIRDGWFAVIGDVFAASLDVLVDKRNGKPRTDEPTDAEIRRASEIYLRMRTRRPTRDAFKEAAKSDGLKVSSAKAGKLLKIVTQQSQK